MVAGLAASGTAEAGPIRVGITPAEAVEGPVLVRVYGHYADLHNGHSSHWKDAFLPAGKRRFIPLGPVLWPLNMGVSVHTIHPELLSAGARSHSTPLLLRPVSFDDLEPRSWRNVMASGEIRFGARPETPGGHVVFQAWGHLLSFLNGYLPALDSQPKPLVSEALLTRQLALIEEIARYALAAEPPESIAPRPMAPAKQAAYERSMREQALRHRVELEDFLYRIREWLSLDREARRTLRALREQARYPQRVSEQLMTDADRRRLGDYIAEAAEDAAAKRKHEKSRSWRDPSTRVSYRVWISKPAGRCARLTVSTDLTTVVDADLDDLVRSVSGRFCRDDDGGSSFQSS
jgi:hypothetical protein